MPSLVSDCLQPETALAEREEINNIRITKYNVMKRIVVFVETSQDREHILAFSIIPCLIETLQISR